MLRIQLPVHLRVLANIPTPEIQLDVPTSPATINAILDALEQKYPSLKGTIRDHNTTKRRPMIRFYACNQDLSHDPPDSPVPDPIQHAQQPLYIIAAIAGG